MTDHHLTDGMILAALNGWTGCDHPSLDRYDYLTRLAAERALTAALAVDDRPWEPLNGYKPRVGDEVRQERPGLTITGVVGRLDAEEDPWTADDLFIGEINLGTWYVRRAAHTPPPERDGAVLIPADGCRAITTTAGQEFSRLTFTTKQSIWYGPNLAARPGDWVIQTTSPGRLILGTWKVEEK